MKLTDEQKAAYEAEGRRPHYRFKLLDEEVAWTDLVRGDVVYHMSSLSDPVIIREDGRVIYTLASVVDDIDHEITAILRGEDHVTNSAAQIQLFEALGASAPQMGHLALLSGAEGEGLSKRLGSLSIEELRQDGVEPMAVASVLGRIGTSQSVQPLSAMAALIDSFDISAFGRATAKFDPQELHQINARIVQQYEFDEVKDRVQELGIDDAAFWLAVRGNLASVSDAKIWWDVCHSEITPVMEDADLCQAAMALLPSDDITDETWKPWTKAVADQTGKKGRSLFMPLRLALTGQASGPEMAGLLPFLGRERIMARLQGQNA